MDLKKNKLLMGVLAALAVMTTYFWITQVVARPRGDQDRSGQRYSPGGE